MSEWFVQHKGKWLGPINGAKIRSLVAKGKLTHKTKVNRKNEVETMTIADAGLMPVETDQNPPHSTNELSPSAAPPVTTPSTPSPASPPAIDDRSPEPHRVGVIAFNDLPTVNASDRKAGNAGAQAFDNGQKVGLAIVGGGILLLMLSPFFTWVKFGAGGVTGITGDGRILLAVTSVAGAVFIAGIIHRRCLSPAFLLVQVWATLAVMWMAAMIWRISTVFNASELTENPLAAIFATQITPGSGLYIGLIGGIMAATALGYVLVRQLRTKRQLPYFYIMQGLACVLGMLLVLLLGTDRFTSSNDSGIDGDKPFSLFDFSGGDEEPVVQASLGKTFTLGNLEITPKNIKLRTLSER